MKPVINIFPLSFSRTFSVFPFHSLPPLPLPLLHYLFPSSTPSSPPPLPLPHLHYLFPSSSTSSPPPLPHPPTVTLSTGLLVPTIVLRRIARPIRVRTLAWRRRVAAAVAAAAAEAALLPAVAFCQNSSLLLLFNCCSVRIFNRNIRICS